MDIWECGYLTIDKRVVLANAVVHSVPSSRPQTSFQTLGHGMSNRELDVLYTDKELSMHVYGPSRPCDLRLLHNHGDISNLTAEEALSFYRDGFVSCRDMIDKTHVDEARMYIDSNYSAWIKKSRRQDDWRIHLMVNFEESDTQVIEHGPIMDLLLQSPRVIEKLRGLIGAPPGGIFYNQCGYRTPLSLQPGGHNVALDYQSGAEYHIDGNCNTVGTRFPDPFTILMGVALVDITTDRKGNFTVFPGGHRLDWTSYPSQKMSKTLPHLGSPHKVCLAAGDVIFAHCLLPHRGGKNVLTAEEIADHHTISIFDGAGHNVIKNIQPGTREMIFFRVRAKGRPYDDLRNAALLADPWVEHRSVLDLITEDIEH